MPKEFSHLTCMRVEILIDPVTLDYQVDMEGTHSVLLAALRKIVEDLENPEIVDQLAVDPN